MNNKAVRGQTPRRAPTRSGGRMSLCSDSLRSYPGCSVNVSVSRHLRPKGGTTEATRLVFTEVSRGHSTNLPMPMETGRTKRNLSEVHVVNFFRDLDIWIRRRLRACYWKQWKNKRTRIANLSKLGIREDEAVTHGCSSKGPWVMSSSLAVHGALSNNYLSEVGFTSLQEIWKKLAAKLRTA